MRKININFCDEMFYVVTNATIELFQFGQSIKFPIDFSDFHRVNF